MKIILYILFSDEYDPSTGLLIRTCEENVAVNKCEGQCASSIYPSALNAYGFQKVINGLNLLLYKNYILTRELRFEKCTKNFLFKQKDWAQIILIIQDNVKSTTES